MKNHKVLISIIVPCRNEEIYIKECIDSILNFEIPVGIETEILIIDGMSEDETRNIIAQFDSTDIEVIDNPKIIQATALNIGIKKSRGQYIMRLDAHSKYPENYLRLCYETSLKTEAANVGGIVVTKLGSDTVSAKLVQAISTSKFGVGNSEFRIGNKEGIVDTVPFGFFRSSIFDEIGTFDERLVRAQDYELNQRLILNGYTIWQNPNIYIEYYNQSSFGKFLSKQFHKEAPYNAYMWYIAPYTFNLRHSITLFFVLGLIFGAILSFFYDWLLYIHLCVIIIYFLCTLIASISKFKGRNTYYVVLLPICFFLFHSIHGLGVLRGSINVILGNLPFSKIKK